MTANLQPIPAYIIGTCPECLKENRTIGPLHGSLGGPRCCLQCGMNWHGKYGARRKAGRLAARAIKAFLNAGGTTQQVGEISLCAQAGAVGLQFGIGEDWNDSTSGADLPDLTTELLADTLRLTHPDVHPPERNALAQRVTTDLLALAPFVFPAPTPESPPEPGAPARDPLSDFFKSDPTPCTTPTYPCVLCAGEIPWRYCTACRAEWKRREEDTREKQRQKERAWYRARKARTRWRQRRPCATCGTPFDPKRTDQLHCRSACRQRAHRQRGVADKSSSHVETLNTRYDRRQAEGAV